MPFESNTETGRISVMKGSRRVLVKVVLFQLRGHSQPQNDATPNFFANSKRPILRLSNEISFIQEYHLEGGQKSQNLKAVIQLVVNMQISVNPTRLQFGSLNEF